MNFRERMRIRARLNCCFFFFLNAICGFATREPVGRVGDTPGAWRHPVTL